MTQTKVCTKCGEDKPLEAFSEDKYMTCCRKSYCKLCACQYAKARYDKDPSVKAKAIVSAYKSRSTLKAELLEAYGGKCECCGETIPEFLTIDHKKGNGQTHRNAGYSGTALYGLLRSLGYPRDDYRLLCFNCNCGRGQFGECPHKHLTSNIIT